MVWLLSISISKSKLWINNWTNRAQFSSAQSSPVQSDPIQIQRVSVPRDFLNVIANYEKEPTGILRTVQTCMISLTLAHVHSSFVVHSIPHTHTHKKGKLFPTTNQFKFNWICRRTDKIFRLPLVNATNKVFQTMRSSFTRLWIQSSNTHDKMFKHHISSHVQQRCKRKRAMAMWHVVLVQCTMHKKESSRIFFHMVLRFHFNKFYII